MMRHHIVVTGENLSTLSKYYYGCEHFALAIFQANRDVIQDPANIYSNQTLVIPHITELHHGRNC